MHDRPLVTIVTPSFNQAAYLEEAIVSVLEQDYEPIEYIVVDGGSTDGSVDIIRRYEDRLAWWESKPDGGQAAALNDAFARSQGELFGWLNSDDTLLPGSVEVVARALEGDPEALFAYGNAIYTDAESRPTGVFESRDLDVVEMTRDWWDPINPQGAVFRRRALELGGPFTGFYCWDFEFMLRLGLVGHAVRLDRAVATFRVHDESKGVAAPSRRAEDCLAMQNRFFATPGLPPEVRTLEPAARAVCLLWCGQLFYADGDHERARRCFAEGVRLHPRAILGRNAAYLARALLPRRIAVGLRSARRRG